MIEHTILVIDDSPGVRSHLTSVLSSVGHYRILSAADGLEGYKVLISRPVDLVLCDVSMPGLDGFKLLNLLRTRSELQDIPVIMLTGTDDVVQKVRALDQGAKDYLVKPVHDAELVARVSVHVQLRQLQRELRARNAQLEMLSNTDPLTQLLNRRHFMEIAEVELLRAFEADRPLALIMLDIDHFKQINDGHGHLQGDEVIRGVARVLRENLRIGDVAARYGGEEYIVLLRDTRLDGAIAVAERFRQGIEAMPVTSKGRLSLRARAERAEPLIRLADASGDSNDARAAGPIWPGSSMDQIRVTASVGVTAFPDEPAAVIDDLLVVADRALYRAKRDGRNRVCVAHRQLGEQQSFAPHSRSSSGP